MPKLPQHTTTKITSRFQQLQEELEKERQRKEWMQIKEDRRKEREEMRRMMRMKKKKEEESRRLQERINLEERKILIARRKLESIRLFSQLFNRIKVSLCIFILKINLSL